MARYRRKPVEVEARQYDGTPESWRELNRWSEGAFSSNEEQSTVVQTAAGWKFMLPGWWIIRDAKGLYRVCGDTEFRENYEPIGEAQD